MRCMNCQADIPPQWKKAIQRNQCPSCDGYIMDEQTRTLLSELTDAMSKMPNDPEGLAGWLLSNYNLQKIGTAEPTVFFNKPGQKTSQNKQQEDFSHLKVNKNNPAYEYMKRAGLSKEVIDRKPLEQIAKEIQQNADIEVEEDYQDEPFDEQEAMEREEMEASGPPKIRAKDVYGNNSLVVSEPGVEPLSPEEIRQVIAISQKASGLDLANSDLHPALQADRLKRLRAAEDAANGIQKGGGRGGISVSRRG